MISTLYFWPPRASAPTRGLAPWERGLAESCLAGLYRNIKGPRQALSACVMSGKYLTWCLRNRVQARPGFDRLKHVAFSVFTVEGQHCFDVAVFVSVNFGDRRHRLTATDRCRAKKEDCGCCALR